MRSKVNSLTSHHWEMKPGRDPSFHLFQSHTKPIPISCFVSNIYSVSQSVQLLSHVWLFVTPWTACSTPGFPVHHQLLEFTQTHVHWVTDNHLILCHPFSSCLQSLPASGSFPMSQFFASGGQSIAVSASVSVLPMNIQDWFPLGRTGWISLLSKELSKTTVQKHQFFGSQLSLWANSHIHTWPFEKP